jgi:hypothetical protein
MSEPDWKTNPEVGDPHTITQRLMRAMLTSEDKTLIIEKLDRDLSRHKAWVEELHGKVRTLEIAHTDRFTRGMAKDLFAELFRDDAQKRAFLARLVKLVYLPVGLLSLTLTADLLVHLLK